MRPRGTAVLQRVLPHYRLAIFRRLSVRVAPFFVAYGEATARDGFRNADGSHEPWMRRFHNIYIGRAYVTPKAIFAARRHTVVINAELGNLNLPLLICFRRLLGCRIVLWTFGYDPKRGFSTGDWKDRLRLWMYDQADAIVFYWRQGRDSILPYLKHPSRTFVAPNTLETDVLDSIRERLAQVDRRVLAERAGASGRAHFLFLGRLLADKEADRLLRAWKEVEAGTVPVALTVVGDGPERSSLEELARVLELRTVRFAGEITDAEAVGRMLVVSRAVVVPGRLGLTVVHAFCFGVPVISQAKPSHFHGEGIGYVRDGENGILVPDGDISALARAILLLAENDDVHSKMSNAARQTVEEEASIDLMVSGLVDAVELASRG